MLNVGITDLSTLKHFSTFPPPTIGIIKRENVYNDGRPLNDCKMFHFHYEAQLILPPAKGRFLFPFRKEAVILLRDISSSTFVTSIQ